LNAKTSLTINFLNLSSLSNVQTYPSNLTKEQTEDSEEAPGDGSAHRDRMSFSQPSIYPVVQNLAKMHNPDGDTSHAERLFENLLLHGHSAFPGFQT
jgi:hypothetical protein